MCLNEHGFTIWLTGLPGAGKTTLAKLLEEKLKSMGYRVENLDGDEIRRGISSDLGFSKEDREKHIKRVTYVAKVLTRNGVIVIVSLISPYRKIREYARKEIGNFVEVFVNCPVEICEKRDPKGLYKKARAGEIKDFTGISAPYEEPLNPEVVVNTHLETPEESCEKIIEKIKEIGYI